MLGAAVAAWPAAGQATTAPTTRPVKWVGVYSQRAGDLAWQRERWGVNFAMHWESESGKVTQRQWRAAAIAAGLKGYVDTYLDDADAEDPYLIGWIVKGSDEWNRARGNPATRPAVAPFVAEAQKLAALNKARGSNKLILANADGPSITTALFENPPYAGVKNNEQALLRELSWPSLDWYPVMLTAADTPEQIARRPMYLPAQAAWRLKTWADAWGVKHDGYCVIVEAAKRWNSPLGPTSAQMREQMAYLTGGKAFPVPDAKGKVQSFQGPVADMVVWWVANGQDGPGWKWVDVNADQEAALIEITAGLLKAPTLPTDPVVAALKAEVVGLRADVARAAVAADAARVEAAGVRGRLEQMLKAGAATQPAAGGN